MNCRLAVWSYGGGGGGGGGTVYCGPMGPFAQGAARPQYENSSRAKTVGAPSRDNQCEATSSSAHSAPRGRLNHNKHPIVLV